MSRIRSRQVESEAVPTRVLRKDAATSEKIGTHSVRWNKEQWPGGPKVRQGDLSPGVVELIEEKAGGFGFPATITVELAGQEVPSGEWTPLVWTDATRNNLMGFDGAEVERPVGGTWHWHDVAVVWEGVGFDSVWKGGGVRLRVMADGEQVWPDGLETNTAPSRGLPVPAWAKESVPTEALPDGLSTLEVLQTSGETQTVARAYASLSLREPRSSTDDDLDIPEPLGPGGVNLWTQLDDSPVDWVRAAFTQVDGSLYLCGGHTDSDQVARTIFYRFDPPGTWTQLAPLPVALAGHAACPIVGGILVVGGYSGSSTSASSRRETYQYDIGTDTWTTGAPMIDTRKRRPALGVHRDGVVVAGGFSGGSTGNTLSSAEQLVDGSWSAIASLGGGSRAGLGLGLSDGRLLAGFDTIFSGADRVVVLDEGWAAVSTGIGLARLIGTVGDDAWYFRSGTTDFRRYTLSTDTTDVMQTHPNTGGEGHRFRVGQNLYVVGGGGTPRQVWRYES